MAIAANYRKFPQAMALQLVLPLGKPVWNTSRPTTRLGRAIRAHISRVVKVIGPVVYPEAKSAPQWCKDATKAAHALARSVKAACLGLDFNADKCQRFDTYDLFPWLQAA